MMRSTFLFGLICIMIGCSTYNPFANSAKSYSSQTVAPSAHQIMFGSAVNYRAFQTDTDYRQALVKYVHIITPENALKFSVTEPYPGTFDFTQGDTIVGFAQSMGWPVRGTCFVWHNSNPKWLSDDRTLSDSKLKELLNNHIGTEIRHFNDKFPGVIRYWDVANELIDQVGNLRSDNPWAAISAGNSNYIAFAFRSAHEADPSAVLFYNDFDIEQINAKSNGVYNLVKDLLKQGVPIGGIGFQSHLKESGKYDYDSIAKNFKRFSDLGLVIHITEIDVRLNLSLPGAPSSEKIAAQAEVYRSFGKICVENPKCEAFITWSLSDKFSYVPKDNPGWGVADLLDVDYHEKFAFKLLLPVLKRSE